MWSTVGLKTERRFVQFINEVIKSLRAEPGGSAPLIPKPFIGQNPTPFVSTSYIYCTGRR
jgi:hypothetical protein